MPNAVYSDAVDRVRIALHQVNAIVRFDWIAWDVSSSIATIVDSPMLRLPMPAGY
jgi:hypothetical protein